VEDLWRLSLKFISILTKKGKIIMKRVSQLTMLVAILGLILLVGCEKQSNNPTQVLSSNQNEMTGLAKSGDKGPSASGQGSFIYEDGHRRIFTFHAVTSPDGSVKGAGEIRKVSSNPELREKIHFDIDCLDVNGNVAVMSGVITSAGPIVYNPGDPVAVGEYVQLKVVDHGEGANAAPDEISWCNHGFEVPPCDVEDVTYDLFDIDAGNIQVRE
jgi:hypothetical protein